MASQNKIIEMIGAIKTIYSYYARDTDVSVLVKTWTMLLKNYDDALVEAAFYKCLQTCKMPPTPADVIEAIKDINKTNEATDEELWSTYCKALESAARLVTQFGYTYVDSSGVSQGDQARKKFAELFDSLPEKVKGYLASKNEFHRSTWDFINDLDYLKYEKPRFLKQMPIMEKRQEFSSLLIEGGNNKHLLTQKG